MKPHHGFTLLEMAVALLVIGLLLGNFIVPLSARLDTQRIKRTDKTLEEIKEALLGFALINGRLPCAAPKLPYVDNDGINIPISEEEIGKEHLEWCDKEGFLPWKDLGVGRYDGWGNRFRYRADKVYANGIPNSLKTENTSYRLKIQNKNKDIDLTSEEDYSGKNYSRLVAIIFSSGKNNRAENENDDGDNIYIQDVYVEDREDETNTFDDRLIWLSKYTLMNRLIAAKQWYPR